MPLPRWLLQAAGNYAGLSDLYFQPDKIEETCEATATLELTNEDQAILYRYQWSRERKPATGVLMVATDDAHTKMVWTDSWHHPKEVMRLEGANDGEVLQAAGSYPAPSGPDWGWRIELHPGNDPGTLLLRMVNIEPDGEETLAVEAHMRRKIKG